MVRISADTRYFCVLVSVRTGFRGPPGLLCDGTGGCLHWRKVIWTSCRLVPSCAVQRDNFQDIILTMSFAHGSACNIAVTKRKTLQQDVGLVKFLLTINACWDVTLLTPIVSHFVPKAVPSAATHRRSSHIVITIRTSVSASKPRPS